MIRLKNATKAFAMQKKVSSSGIYTVFDNLNITFEDGQKYALIGRNGAGKSTLINMLAGLERPTSGKIIRKGNISWPVGYAGFLVGSLSARQNINFVTRLYGMNQKQRQEAMNFCEEFVDIGKHFNAPMSTYSSGMKARISFVISMACDFDYYLLDEVTATGDKFFVNKAKAFLRNKLEKSGFIFVSHNVSDIREICNHFGVIYNKNIVFFSNFKEANEFYNKINA